MGFKLVDRGGSLVYEERHHKLDNAIAISFFGNILIIIEMVIFFSLIMMKELTGNDIKLIGFFTVLGVFIAFPGWKNWIKYRKCKYRWTTFGVEGVRDSEVFESASWSDLMDVSAKMVKGQKSKTYELNLTFAVKGDQLHGEGIPTTSWTVFNFKDFVEIINILGTLNPRFLEILRESLGKGGSNSTVEFEEELLCAINELMFTYKNEREGLFR